MADEVPVAPLASYEHEFDEADNQQFSKLAGAMRFVAISMLVLGVIFCLVGVMSMSAPLSALISIGQGVVFLLISGWLNSAATAFRDIVRTEGNDLMNLMYAMTKLRSVFRLQAWLIGIACVLFVLALFLVLGRSHP